VWSHAPRDSGASPLAPWVEIVRGAIGDTEVAALTAGLDGVAAVQALGLVPDLIPVELAAVGDPPPDRLALFDGTAHLLRNLARDQPLVVVLDDFDAAGIASLRFLEFLVPELPETPMLVVSIWPESAPSSLDGDAHRLVLSPLEAGESARQHRAPAHDVDPGASVSRAERAGDNALAELAWEDAAGHYRRALAVLTATDATDAPEADDDRARLLLAAGRALLSAGDAGGGRSAYDEAADLARRRGRPDDLARAALGLSATLEAFDPSPLDPAARRAAR